MGHFFSVRNWEDLWRILNTLEPDRSVTIRIFALKDFNVKSTLSGINNTNTHDFGAEAVNDYLIKVTRHPDTDTKSRQ